MTSDKTKAQQIRELRVKANFDRISATCFLLIGVVLSIMIYFNKVSGHEFETIRHNPLVFVLLLVPLLPAVFLARRLEKTRRKIEKLRETSVAVSTSPPAEEPAKPAH